MTNKEYANFIESSYQSLLKHYADYANQTFFRDSSLKVSAKDMDAVFTQMMSLSQNVTKLTYVKRVSRGQKILIDKAELNLLASYMQDKLLAHRLGAEKYAQLKQRALKNWLNINDLIYDGKNEKYIRAFEVVGRKYNNDEQLFADFGIMPVDLAEVNAIGFTIHKGELQPLTKYKDLSAKGITKMGQFMLYTPQDLLAKGFSKKFVAYLTICGHTASEREIADLQSEELFEEMNEMQKEAFCRKLGERAMLNKPFDPTKSSLIGNMLNIPKVKYDYAPNNEKISIDDIIKTVSSMAEFDALTPTAKRKYVESTFNKDR